MDFLISPLVNALLIFYSVLGNSFPLAIIVLTVLVRLVTLPLTLPQQRSMRRMNALQPQLKEIQKKYAGNRQKLSEEQMKLYREYGVNPLGGCLPLILQLFIMIALYNAITGSLALTPLQLMELSHRVGPSIAPLLPINSRFLWLDLGQPDPFFALPILVVVTTYLQQKVMTPANPDPTASATARQMNIITPLMFGMFALQFASGLSIYFIVSNLIGIAQYTLIGRKNVVAPAQVENKPVPAKNKAAAKK
ncbi:MAG TPA: YidC/Oxa1 family membrane protein insertase [Anaerolineae bacterium]|nr:YidC/Oxa1 family membrane protein insertase [Anaerolineae bacterium]